MIRQFLYILAVIVGFSGSLMPLQAQAQVFQLSGVTFTDSVYLNDAQLDRAVSPYLNRDIEFGDVEAMIADVQTLYTSAGILTARVLLLPQTVTDGNLELTLVEASIGELSFEGLEGTRPEFLQRNLSLRTGELPDYEQLEKDLRIFEIVHDFAPHLQFGEGGEFGTVSAIVSADPPEENSWTVSLDNYGSDSTGKVRGTLQALFPNLTGNRDRIVLQVQGTQGGGNADVTYLFPIGAGGGVAYATANVSRAEIVSGDFAVLGLVSDNYGATVGYRRPFLIRPESHFMVDVFATQEFSSSQLTALSFQEHDVREYGVQFSYQKVADGKSWSASVGLKGGDVETLETSETEGEYYIGFATGGHARAIRDNLLLDFAVTAQIAERQNLASPRLYSAGGTATVRGYPNNIRNGDSGVVLRAQLTRLDARPFESVGGDWAPFGFVDFGVVKPYRDDDSFDPSTDQLFSVGGGYRATFGENVRGLGTLAVPLLDTEGFDGKGQPVLSIGIDYTF